MLQKVFKIIFILLFLLSSFINIIKKVVTLYIHNLFIIDTENDNLIILTSEVFERNFNKIKGIKKDIKIFSLYLFGGD